MLALLPLADIAVGGLILALIASAIILVIVFLVTERMPMPPLARTLLVVVAVLVCIALIYNAVD